MEELIKNTDLSKNKPMRDVVYESLKEIIIEGKIPLGERIVEKEFADRLNISRTPVREALRKLEMDDLVEYIPRTGVVVKKIGKEDVIEIYKIRKVLEILAYKSAAENITKDKVKKIQDLLDETERQDQAGNVETVFAMFREFNNHIYDMSKMYRLKNMIDDLNQYLKRFRRISIGGEERRTQAIQEHRMLLDTLIKKDLTKMEQIIEKHLDSSLEIVVDYFDNL